MALNKDDKDNIKTALFYLGGGLKNQPEIGNNAENTDKTTTHITNPKIKALVEEFENKLKKVLLEDEV